MDQKCSKKKPLTKKVTLIMVTPWGIVATLPGDNIGNDTQSNNSLHKEERPILISCSMRKTKRLSDWEIATQIPTGCWRPSKGRRGRVKSTSPTRGVLV